MMLVVTEDYKEGELDLHKIRNYKYIHIINSKEDINYYIEIENLVNPKQLSMVNDIRTLNTNTMNFNYYSGIKQTKELSTKIHSSACEYCISKGGYLGTIQELSHLIEYKKELMEYFNITEGLQLFWSSSNSNIDILKNYCYAVDGWVSRLKVSVYSVFPLYKEIKRD